MAMTDYNERRYWNPVAQTMRRPELEKLQVERLRESIAQANEAPFFRQRLLEAQITADDIRTVADTRQLPTFVKADLRDDEATNPPIGSYRARGLSDAVRIAMSSGTTGRPTAAMLTR